MLKPAIATLFFETRTWARASGSAARNILLVPQASRHAGDWTAEEAKLEDAATRARTARDRTAGPAENVRAAAALARFANRVADAAEAARPLGDGPLAGLGAGELQVDGLARL